VDKIIWTKDLKLGIEILDQQHKELIKRISEIIDSVNLNEKIDKTIDLMKKFKNEAMRHFSTEEKYMENSYYPDTAGHKRLHVKFMEEFQSIANKILKNNAGLECALQIKEDIGDWFVRHIRMNDLNLATYIETKV
jgi:hemerythrin